MMVNKAIEIVKNNNGVYLQHCGNFSMQDRLNALLNIKMSIMDDLYFSEQEKTRILETANHDYENLSKINKKIC